MFFFFFLKFISCLYPRKVYNEINECDLLMSSSDDSFWALSTSTVYGVVCVTVHFTTFPKGSIYRVMQCFSSDTTQP